MLTRAAHAPARGPGIDHSAESRRFVLTAMLWGVALFVATRLPLVEQQLLVPLTIVQAAIAKGGLHAPAAPVSVTLACSGADVLSLCLAVILAYPAAWRMRLAGAAVGLLFVLTINTLRIATLGQAFSTPMFGLLHFYIWPAALVFATLAYVGLWMWLANRASASRAPSVGAVVRFTTITFVFVALYIGASPWILEAEVVRRIAVATASAGGFLLALLGLHVTVSGAVVVTPHGAYAVTPECVLSPLMPVYLSAIVALPLSRGRRVAAALAFIPIFWLLTTLRLVTLAIPRAVVGETLFVTHGFHQLVLAAVLVAAVAQQSGRFKDGSSGWRTLLGLAGMLAVVLLIAGPYARMLTAVVSLFLWAAPHALTTLVAAGDDQGALALLPMYQLGLFAALWYAARGVVVTRAFAWGVFGLFVFQAALLIVLGESRHHAGIAPPVVAIRALAVACPALAFATLSDVRSWLRQLAGEPREPRSSPGGGVIDARAMKP